MSEFSEVNDLIAAPIFDRAATITPSVSYFDSQQLYDVFNNLACSTRSFENDVDRLPRQV
jgi:hypothetical protein